jgi:hypothetical protein
MKSEKYATIQLLGILKVAFLYSHKNLPILDYSAKVLRMLNFHDYTNNIPSQQKHTYFKL